MNKKTKIQLLGLTGLSLAALVFAGQEYFKKSKTEDKKPIFEIDDEDSGVTIRYVMKPAVSSKELSKKGIQAVNLMFEVYIDKPEEFKGSKFVDQISYMLDNHFQKVVFNPSFESEVPLELYSHLFDDIEHNLDASIIGFTESVKIDSKFEAKKPTDSDVPGIITFVNKAYQDNLKKHLNKELVESCTRIKIRRLYFTVKVKV